MAQKFGFYNPNNDNDRNNNGDSNPQNQNGSNNNQNTGYSQHNNSNLNQRSQSGDRNNHNSGSYRGQNRHNQGGRGGSNNFNSSNQRSQSGDRNNQNSSSYRGSNRPNQNGFRNNQNSGSYQRNSNNRRGFNTSNGNSSASLYDATLYNFFDGTKHLPDYGYSDQVITYTLPNGQSKKISKSVIDIIGMIFKEDEMLGIISEYSINPSLIIANKLTADMILEALKKLSSLAMSFANHMNGNGSSSSGGAFAVFKKKKDPLSDFLKLMQFIQQPVITTTQQIQHYSHGLNDILLIKDALDIINEHRGDPNLFYRYYKALQTKIRPVVQDDDEYKKILEYLEKSHGPTHDNFSLDIVDIFKISRRAEFRKYDHFKKNFGFPKLLWFGTRRTNYPSILLNGLQIAPQQSPSIGNMFGKGIYFTDCVSKAAKNCRATTTNPEGILLLAEVALGKTLKLTKAEDITFIRNGKNSVKGLGKYEPDKDQHFLTHNGVQVPLGNLKYNSSLTTDLNYNEYVVYNPHQILLQYLVRVKFNFK
ncbi:poly [ADP-ribose] polymerase-like [Condylostylus longicornis]|uniref:poly [ADP-ribose] polymerase-like n=1 Tax=Condylostylus longicornis TaxID=2530218 RepID=UPI00244E2C7A|nr:poly [ADP-ribose] polymerase-like [Condylostylus longicornis]